MAQGVILGQGRRTLQIVVPPDMADVMIGRCTVPGCGARFFEGEEAAWQKHVGPCGRRNLDKIKANMARHPLYDDWDPEVTKHMREVGKTMIREGRMTIKPNETAGFS